LSYLCVCIYVCVHLSLFKTSFLHFFSDILTFLDEVEHCCDTTTESAGTQFQAVKDTTQNELSFTAVPRLVNLFMLIKFEWYIYDYDTVFA